MLDQLQIFRIVSKLRRKVAGTINNTIGLLGKVLTFANKCRWTTGQRRAGVSGDPIRIFDACPPQREH